MQTQKMSLANIQEKLSRAEMKKIMAGSYSGSSSWCSPNGTGCYSSGGVQYYCQVQPNLACCCGHDYGNSNCVMIR